MITNWKKELVSEMNSQNEKWEDIVSCTLSEEELEEEFDNGYGGSQGRPFTLWTKKRVYFPVVYDGSEWVESVSRKPDGKPTSHFGSE